MPATPEPPGDRDRRDDPPEGTARALGRYGGHGITIGAATALFTWLGHLADGWLHTAPAFVILGAIVGFGGGFFAMYRDLVLEPGEDRDDGAGDGSRPR